MVGEIRLQLAGFDLLRILKHQLYSYYFIAS
jgi:hypothetical protein